MFPYDKLYDEWNIKRPLPILNECIQKRYRDNGYQVVFVLYPDKEIFGINLKEEDKIIYTDVLFSEASAIDENKNMKENFIPKYLNEKLLFNQLENIDKLVVGGFHAQDCVKRVAQYAFNIGIDTLIDLDMTDFFYNLYKKEDYFKVENYDPIRYKEYIYSEKERVGKDFIDRVFNETYSSSIYGFNLDNKKIK